jgi:hypothetical protein
MWLFPEEFWRLVPGGTAVAPGGGLAVGSAATARGGWSRRNNRSFANSASDRNGSVRLALAGS